MAAPPEITIKDLTGDWTMNKSLSDDIDAVLAMQGIGWVMRRAISWATVTLHARQYIETTSSPITHIDIEQTATGGIKGTTENRTLDWTAREHSDYMFGTVRGRSRWVAAGSEVWGALEPFLTEGWEEGDEEKGGPEGESHVHSWVVNEERGWMAEQVWGFVVLGPEGERYHARRVVVTKDGEMLSIRLIYDWKGKN